MLNPSMTVPFVNQGGRDGKIGHEGEGIPITIDGSRLGSVSVKVKARNPYLFARRTASPSKALPFQNNGAIINPTNVTNATADVADADAVKFRVSDSCTFVNQTTGAISSETKVISAIGASGSGGAGETLVTFTGVWTTPPVAGNLLVVADGAELSANVVMVEDELDFDGATDFASTGYLTGIYNKATVGGQLTTFDNSKQPGLRLVTI